MYKTKASSAQTVVPKAVVVLKIFTFHIHMHICCKVWGGAWLPFPSYCKLCGALPLFKIYHYLWWIKIVYFIMSLVMHNFCRNTSQGIMWVSVENRVHIR